MCFVKKTSLPNKHLIYIYFRSPLQLNRIIYHGLDYKGSENRIIFHIKVVRMTYLVAVLDSKINDRFIIKRIKIMLSCVMQFQNFIMHKITSVHSVFESYCSGLANIL
jgi:hypothetical protein